MPNRPLDPALDATVAPRPVSKPPAPTVAATERISRERSMKPFFVGVGICVALAVGALLYKKHLQTAHDEAVEASATPAPTPAPPVKTEQPKAQEPKVEEPSPQNR